MSRTGHIFRLAQPLLRVNRAPQVPQVPQVVAVRSAITTPSGAILPEPKTPKFSYVSVVLCVGTGLGIGALISQQIASFLEETELFVPSDDDDDDDD